MRSFLRLTDYTKEELLKIFEIADSIEQYKGFLAGKTIAIVPCKCDPGNKFFPAFTANRRDKEEFVIFKNERLVILLSPNLAKIQIELGSIVFCDATFFIAPKFALQVFRTRVYSDLTNSYYTTSFSIMKGKTINPLSSPYRAHTPIYIITFSGGVYYVR
jgi:hypothetical protein